MNQLVEKTKREVIITIGYGFEILFYVLVGLFLLIYPIVSMFFVFLGAYTGSVVTKLIEKNTRENIKWGME